jgi:uncharacterized protein YcgI (DUF1989 family)
LLIETGIKPPQFTPTPLNLFMNVPIQDDRTTFSFEKADVEEGQYVCLKAVVDVVMIFSACPQVSLRIMHSWCIALMD